MDWFRLYHRAPTDPKWLTIARRAHAKPGEVWAVFTALLDHASQHEDRGSVEGFDVESVACFYGFEETTVGAILDALIAKGIVADDRIACWEKRQPVREEDGASTERVRRFRERQRDAAVKRDETQRNARNAPEESRGEEISLPPLTPPSPETQRDPAEGSLESEIDPGSPRAGARAGSRVIDDAPGMEPAERKARWEHRMMQEAHATMPADRVTALWAALMEDPRPPWAKAELERLNRQIDRRRGKPAKAKPRRQQGEMLYSLEGGAPTERAEATLPAAGRLRA